MGFVDRLTGKEAAQAATQAGETQAQATERAAEIQAEVQREAMALGAPFREIELQGARRLGGLASAALPQFQALSGLQGPEAQMAAEQAILESPAQQALRDRAARLSTRSAAAIGGLGGGNIRSQLFEQGRILDLQALANRRSELGGLVGMQPGAGATQFGAGQLSQLGAIQAGGLTGAAQARASGLLGGAQAKSQALTNLMQLGGQIGAAALSDRRLKKNIVKVGEHNGLNVYEFDYIWGGRYRGVMADEVLKVKPEAVVMVGEYMAVNYGEL